MDAIASLRETLASAHWLVEETMEGVTGEQAGWQPPGCAHPIGALYAHIVLREDGVLHELLQGKPPLAATEWAGKTGVSETPPIAGDWTVWGRKVQIDLPRLRQYAQAVYGATDAYMAGLEPEDLGRQIDAFPGMGAQTLNWMLGQVAIHVSSHIGEVSTIKGLQGLKGYPF